MNMEETITEEPKRPQFLTVLCILTYIGVGIGIIASVGGWWGMRFLANAMEQNGGDLEGLPGMDDPEKLEQTMAMMKYTDVLMASSLICCVICLIGALQMWKQKKMGFYIYAVGEVAPAIVSVACLGMQSFKGWNLMGLFIPVIFLVLYGLNLKHMNK